MYVIFNRMNENQIKKTRKYCKKQNQVHAELSYIYLSVHTYSGLWIGTFFKLGLGKQKKKCFLICHTCLWRKDKKNKNIQMWRENKQNNKPKKCVSFTNRRQKSEAAEGEARCYMWRSVVNICTLLVLFSTLCDVMSLLNRGYSENGTNVKKKKADETRLEKREASAENKEHSPTVQHKFWAPTHNAGYHRNLAVNRLTPGIK